MFCDIFLQHWPSNAVVAVVDEKLLLPPPKEVMFSSALVGWLVYLFVSRITQNLRPIFIKKICRCGVRFIGRLLTGLTFSRHQRPWRRYAHYTECHSSFIVFTHFHYPAGDKFTVSSCRLNSTAVVGNVGLCWGCVCIREIKLTV